MKITRIVYRGATPMVTGKFRDILTHELVDPDAAIVEVYNPEGELMVGNAPMAKDSLGCYHFDVDTSPFTVLGEYTAFITAVRNNRTAIAETKFTLRAKLEE